jgi:phage terminase large subunit
MKDFEELLLAAGLYNEDMHNKSENTYQVGACEFAFFGIDDAQKVRGRKQDILFCNEANELEHEDFKQLRLRTSDTIFIDFNPSIDASHWIYSQVLSHSNSTLIKSSYLDNPHLHPALRAEIELLREQDDQTDWNIYGLGELSAPRERIYTYKLCDEIPADVDTTIYGLDFGFVISPSAYVAIGIKGSSIYIDERVYERSLTNQKLAERMDVTTPESYPDIYADAAEPKSIEEIKAITRTNGMSFNIMPCEKGKDSIMFGIKRVNSYTIHITKRSTNAILEFSRYSRKIDKSTGKVLDEPIKVWDHIPDAVRYALSMFWNAVKAGTGSTDSGEEEEDSLTDNPFAAPRMSRIFAR